MNCVHHTLNDVSFTNVETIRHAIDLAFADMALLQNSGVKVEVDGENDLGKPFIKITFNEQEDAVTNGYAEQSLISYLNGFVAGYFRGLPGPQA